MDSTVAVQTKGFGSLFHGLEKGVNGHLHVGDAEEDAAADGLVVQMTKPSPQPDSSSSNSWERSEVQTGDDVSATPYFLVFVGAVVVHDQM